MFVGFNGDGAYAGFEGYVFGRLKESALPKSAVTDTELSQMFPVPPEETTFFDVSKSTNLCQFTDMEAGRLVDGNVDATQAYITTPFINIAGNDGRYVVPENTRSGIGCNAYAFYDDKTLLTV